MSTGRPPLVRVPHDDGPSPLALARIARGLRQRDLAALVGISRQYLSYAEHGRPLPAHRQEQLAAVLGCSVAALFPKPTTPPTPPPVA
jgi:transcriptional regulator with XRE-family HTH domain